MLYLFSLKFVFLSCGQFHFLSHNALCWRGLRSIFVLMLIFCHMCSFYTDRVGRKEIRQDTAPRNQRETVDDCDIHCSISVPLVFPTRAFPNVIFPNLFPNYSALFYYILPCELLNVCSILPNVNSIHGHIRVAAKL